jgi:hypothetical protein
MYVVLILEMTSLSLLLKLQERILKLTLPNKNRLSSTSPGFRQGVGRVLLPLLRYGNCDRRLDRSLPR